MPLFELSSQFSPMGDQPQAIESLSKGVLEGKKAQTLLGVTGSGKTFSLANVIAKVQKPTLVISHNKTLAAQLYSEFKQFFPNNAVEYFVSYYDYYQPEAYIPQTDTYIEKDASINDELERLRLAATSSLLERPDALVVSSVSCIYGLGSPEDFEELLIVFKKGEQWHRRDILAKLVEIQYERNDIEFKRGTFRVRGDVVEVIPAYSKLGIRFELYDQTLEKISQIDPLTGETKAELDSASIYPAKQFTLPERKIKRAVPVILAELEERLKELQSQNKLLEAQRLESRTRYDMEMLQEIGYCQGIENYSRHLSGRNPGERPYTLIDFFPDDFLLVIDESHATVPQIRGMFNGDRSRKLTLVDHGFRLPSALDNRPLNFDEFESVIPQTIFVSATPGPYELKLCPKPVEQLIRPTGLIDPEVSVRPIANQIDDLIEEIQKRVKKKERILVTTLTKRTAEDLTDYLKEVGIKVRYLHSDIDAIERVEILRGLRAAKFDVLVGINLLREGLDLPEVSLVAILDADKEGFLRSETSLVQTSGRAARHLNGKVIMYADKMTNSLTRALDVMNRRREIQLAYNKKHKITPKGIQRAIQESLSEEHEAEEFAESFLKEAGVDYETLEIVNQLKKEMQEAAERLDFEKAAELRDKIQKITDKEIKRKKKKRK